MSNIKTWLESDDNAEVDTNRLHECLDYALANGSADVIRAANLTVRAWAKAVLYNEDGTWRREKGGAR